MDSSKVAFSVMFAGNAEGGVCLPTLFTNVCIFITSGLKEVLQVPDTTDPSGWFDETTFTDWFFKLMLPKLRRLERRKVLIGDYLSSHLSESVIKACSQNNIAFVCLHPDATSLTTT